MKTPHFEKVKGYIEQLGYDITYQNQGDGIFIVRSEEAGIKELVIGCAAPLLLMEQYMFELTHDASDIMKRLLQKNRDMVHGAFVLDENGTKVIFRDTLQIENLDFNELEGSLNSLQLLLSEFSDEIANFSA